VISRLMALAGAVGRHGPMVQVALATARGPAPSS